MENKKHETEEVIVAEVYIKNSKMGFRYTGDGTPGEIKYFLESYLKVERKYIEDGFIPEKFKERRGLE